MDIEQIERAKQKVDELIKFDRENDRIKEFIDKLLGSQYLNIGTAHQHDLGIGSKEIYELIGVELVEILKKKLREREEYLEKLNADNLIE